MLADSVLQTLRRSQKTNKISGQQLLLGLCRKKYSFLFKKRCFYLFFKRMFYLLKSEEILYKNIKFWDRWHYRVPSVALCITHAEPELTARPWFRSFKLSSGTVRLLRFSRRAGHIRKGKSKICGSYQMQDCTGRNGNRWYTIVPSIPKLDILLASGHRRA